MHSVAANLGAALFATLAGLIVLMNCVAVIASMRARARGLQRRYSTVPLVSLLCLLIAAVLSSLAGEPWLPPRLLLLASLLDVALWELGIFLVSLPIKRFR